MNQTKTLRQLLIALGGSVTAVLGLAQPVMAAITNPGVAPSLGGDPVAAQTGATFALYFITLWRGVIFIGGLMVLIYFLWGAIEWITAGGDSGKVTKARDRLTQSLVGFIILVSTVTILAFLGKLFFGDSLDLFNLSIPNPTELGTGIESTDINSGLGGLPTNNPGRR